MGLFSFLTRTTDKAAGFLEPQEFRDQRESVQLICLAGQVLMVGLASVALIGLFQAISAGTPALIPLLIFELCFEYDLFVFFNAYRQEHETPRRYMHIWGNLLSDDVDETLSPFPTRDAEIVMKRSLKGTLMLGSTVRLIELGVNLISPKRSF